MRRRSAENAGSGFGVLDGVPPEPAGLLLRMRRDDHLVGPELVDRVAQRRDRIGLDDDSVRMHAGLAQEVERPVEPAARGGAPRVVVDDVALARLIHGREHRHDHVGVLRPLLDQLDERRRDDRLVRDD